MWLLAYQLIILIFFYVHWEMKEKEETLFPQNEDAAVAHH
jgi:hypothetical protein